MKHNVISLAVFSSVFLYALQVLHLCKFSATDAMRKFNFSGLISLTVSSISLYLPFHNDLNGEKR